MTWKGKCLLSDHEGLSLNAPHLCKSLVWWFTSTTSALEVRAGIGGPRLCSNVTEKRDIEMENNFKMNNGSLK